jgi:hypothetical protein
MYIKTYIENRNGVLVEVNEHHDEEGIGYTCRVLNYRENKTRFLTGRQALNVTRELTSR